jgi:hypothetical protein
MMKVLLALGGALLLLAALLLVREWQEKAASRAGYAFDTASIGDVTGFSAAYQQDSVSLIRSGGRWIDAADSFPADAAKLTAVLRQILKVQDNERVSLLNDSTRLAEYGLSSAEAKRVEWTLSDGTRSTILLGKTSGTDYNSTYWKRPGEAGVYRTPGNFTYDIPVRPMDWRERNLFPAFGHEEVKFVEVEWADTAGVRTRYGLERADSGYVMTEPVSLKGSAIPAANGLRVFEQASRLVADEFVEPDDPFLSIAGLDSGIVVVRIGMKSGEVRTLAAGNEIGSMHYARHPREPDFVIKIARSRLDVFRKTPDQLMSPSPSRATEGSGVPEAVTVP